MGLSVMTYKCPLCGGTGKKISLYEYLMDKEPPKRAFCTFCGLDGPPKAFEMEHDNEGNL